MTQEKLTVSRNMESRRIHRLLKWIGIVLVMTALSACGGGGGGGSSEDGTTPNTSSNNGGTVANTPTSPSAPAPNAPPPAPPAPAPAPTMPPANDQQLFAQTVHPIMLSNNCVQCHSDPTPLGLTPILPLMADESVETAYNQTVNNQKVNLSNPANSRLVVRTRVDNHNCGGPAACEQFATEMEAAIRSWADSVSASNPPPSNQPRVASAMATLADGQEGESPRADASMIAMFDFSAGAGDIVVDRSGVGVPVDLMIEGMEWVPEGGLRNVSGKAQASLASSQKLFASISSQFSVEAWVIPENLDQSGPARIVSYSADTGGRNFTLGQSGDRYNSRVATNQTGGNGNNPQLLSENDTVTTELTHVVMTYDSAAGGRKIYINGELAAEEDLGNDALNWSNTDLFVIGNEVTNNRLWRGVFRMVAVHTTALSGAEVAQNFDAGLGTITTLAFDVSDVVGAPASVQMQVRELDDNAYVFAVPTLITDVSGVPVKNIRIAVNNNIPVATQSFRSVDTMVTQSGQELSPLGAVIPKDMGPEVDMFHLEFETLGAQVGSGDLYVPPSEPGIADFGVLPEFGVRSFSSVNDTMSALTTIPVTQNTVRNRYEELRDSLPATADILAFNAASQIAIQRLAVTYCDRVRRSNAACNVVFGSSCNNIANATDKQNRVNALFDRFVGDLENQPDRAETTAAVNGLMDELGCANGCTNATKDIALQASCAAVLSSGVMTIN
tara:strand:- start:54611 stop:56794 length:2184 start_codon:yes stop_codon:yes gene_type:complete